MKRAVLIAALIAGSLPAGASPPSNLKTAVATTLGRSADFVYAEAQLDQDYRADALVLVRDRCGSGGCVMLIFKGTPAGYAFVSRSTISSPPIRVLPSSRHGWKDLIVHSKGTGDVVLRFNGTKYPYNPSLQPAATTKQLRLAATLLGEAPNN